MLARDHPRVGGEKQNVKVCQHFRTGSPPRGRGKVKHVLHAVLDVGITPAWAGKRPQKPSPTASKRDHPRTGGEKWGNGMALPNALGSPPHYKDHPRIGGEKAELTAAVISAMGSPPRRRGKEPKCFFGLVSDGVTPA